MKISTKFFITSLLILCAIDSQAIIRYVRPSSYGSGDGSSWENASSDLQLAINQSNAGDTVWVAAGTYVPIRPADNLTKIDSNNRDNSFVLKSELAVLGGFPNTGNPVLNDRDWTINPTILSGDIGIPNHMDDNCYHVVLSSGNVGNACLDGFTITKGNANGNENDKIIVNGSEIGRNSAGGIYIENVSVVLANLFIDSNVARHSGGGIMVTNRNPNSAGILLTNVIISRNSATYGGGMVGNDLAVILTNVLAVKNRANMGGGFFMAYGTFSAFTNVTVSGNVAKQEGAGIYIYKQNRDTLPIRNSIIWGNISDSVMHNHDVYDGYGSAIISYSHCLVGGATIGNGIILNEDPLFMDTANGDYQLNCFSPAIDRGNNAFYSSSSTPNLSAITSDLDGNPRINKTVDLGAYELRIDTFQFTPLSFIYNGTGQSPDVTTLNKQSPNLLYKEKDAPDSAYSPTRPINVGVYTVKAYLPLIGMCDEATDSADFVILPREITVKAIDDTIYYGQIPALAYEIVSGSLANGDVFSGSLYVDNYEVGIHTIEQGTLTAGRNYVITFIEGTLLVWSIQDVFVDNKLAERYKDHFYFHAECGKVDASIYVTCYQCVRILIDGIEQNPYTVALSNYGDNNFIITVIASNGDEETHILTINKPIPFDQVIKMHCDNTITVNNNPANNGGFSFTSYKWFCNDRNFSENQSWVANFKHEWWSSSDLFHVELTANGYSGIIRTCKSRLNLKDMEMVFYPNPVAIWQTLYLKADLDDECLQDAVIEVYDMRGRLVETWSAASLQIPIGDRYFTGVYNFILKGKDGFRKKMEVIIHE